MSGEDAPAQQQNAVDQKQETKAAEEPKSEPAKTEAAEAAATPAPATEKVPEEEAFTYRALVLTGYGGYDKVKLQVKKGKPTLKAGEVQVRVKACGLNFADLMARQGLYDRLPSPPVTPGMECAGVVEAVGEEVTDKKIGDKVMVLNRFGLWQEVVVVPANHTFLIPEGMSFEEAAAIPVNYITAYMLLFDFGNLRPNQSVLIHAAAACCTSSHRACPLRSTHLHPPHSSSSLQASNSQCDPVISAHHSLSLGSTFFLLFILQRGFSTMFGYIS